MLLNENKFNGLFQKWSKVLIPLNRVIVIEYSNRRNSMYNSRRSFNPLKSGHCYWIGKTIVHTIFDNCFNPLKSGHCYWICKEADIDKEVECFNPLKSGHCYWINSKVSFFKDEDVLIPLNRVIVIEWLVNVGALKTYISVLIPLNRVIVIELELHQKQMIWKLCFNPLKSGHCYWINQKFYLSRKD